MTLQVTELIKCHLTQCARKWFLSTMGSGMIFEAIGMNKCLVTQCALKWILPCMGSGMTVEVTG